MTTNSAMHAPILNYIAVGPYDGIYFVAYQIPGTNIYQPVGDTLNQHLAVVESQRLNDEAKKAESKRKRGMKQRFDDWVLVVKARGEKLVPDDDPVFLYADDVKLPIDFVRLAWMEFGRKYREPGARTYIDWRQHFRNAVRENWYRLWYRNSEGTAWCLTARGEQVNEELKARQARDERTS